MHLTPAQPCTWPVVALSTLGGLLAIYQHVHPTPPKVLSANEEGNSGPFPELCTAGSPLKSCR